MHFPARSSARFRSKAIVLQAAKPIQLCVSGIRWERQNCFLQCLQSPTMMALFCLHPGCEHLGGSRAIYSKQRHPDPPLCFYNHSWRLYRGVGFVKSVFNFSPAAAVPTAHPPRVNKKVLIPRLLWSQSCACSDQSYKWSSQDSCCTRYSYPSQSYRATIHRQGWWELSHRPISCRSHTSPLRAAYILRSSRPY